MWYYGFIYIATLLNHYCSSGETALQTARRIDNSDIVRILEADIEAQETSN